MTNPSQGLELEFGTKFPSCLNPNQNNYSKNTFRLDYCSFHVNVYILLINYSLYLPNTYVCVFFPIFNILFDIS